MRQRQNLNEAWAWLTIFFIALGYAFQLDGMLGLAGLLGVVFGLAWVWNRRSLRGVTYQRKLQYRRAFPGEQVESEVRVSNRKWLPLVWLRISDRWPKAVGPLDPDVLMSSHRPDVGFYNMVLSMRGFARTIRSNPLIFRQRGIYSIGPAEALSGDPFGLFLSEDETLADEERVTVFPSVRPIGDLGLRPDDPFGEHATERPLFEDISRPMGVRDYRPEDGFRRIHWPATARMGELQTKLFQPIRGLDLIVCLNASTFEHHWEGTDPEMLEALISMTASIVLDAFESGYRVGLLSNGSIAHSGQAFRIPPARSRNHLPHLLESLAGLTPLVTAPFERYLLDQAPRLEYGSILVLVTVVTPPVLQEALMRLHSRNRKTMLISLAPEPPPAVPNISVLHLPHDRSKRDLA